jgi:hypothetical protein
MMFEITRDRTRGELVLTYLASGLGQPDKPWEPSAYRVARERLNPSE